jgi:hypothetical protein
MLDDKRGGGPGHDQRTQPEFKSCRSHDFKVYQNPDIGQKKMGTGRMLLCRKLRRMTPLAPSPRPSFPMGVRERLRTRTIIGAPFASTRSFPQSRRMPVLRRRRRFWNRWGDREKYQTLQNF